MSQGFGAVALAKALETHPHLASSVSCFCGSSWQSTMGKRAEKGGGGGGGSEVSGKFRALGLRRGSLPLPFMLFDAHTVSNF